MNVNNTNKNQVTAKTKGGDLRSMIMANMDMFKMALPKAITPERMTRIAMTAVTRNPKLALCNQNSFFGALLTAAQLGLEVNTPLGQAYLLPYDSKNGLQCQFQLGYQGMLELAYRSGQFKRIKAIVVHEGDEFTYSYGLNAILEHTPSGNGNPTHVYALYELTNGGVDFEVWTWEKVMQHGMTFSKSFGNGPWQTAPEEMAKKTVLKALLKYAPKAVELAEAANLDEGIIDKKLVRNDGIAEIVTNIEYTEPVQQQTAVQYAEQDPVNANGKTRSSERQKSGAAAQMSKEQQMANEDEQAIEKFELQQNAMFDIAPEFPM
ncbi:recombinase RecT [Treponema phagedenis]|uniref:recombinase RecT n=1 Tax=Treponema phagedenis TaxID=162 RepID=UPI0001F63B30|nr:recombinase RecT [Treponema phagedenis]EFW38628.1 protein RecT [Treponema phagedenis F0421]TYT77790.1 recombination and repair protein RecT [Treponema phagedenis]TYT78087.1 recombination and repair protein RecT [Treponema phagedenis]